VLRPPNTGAFPCRTGALAVFGPRAIPRGNRNGASEAETKCQDDRDLCAAPPLGGGSHCPGLLGCIGEALLPKYLMYALMAEGDDIRRFGGASIHTTIYFPEIRALHICLAPKIEQAEIVRRIDAAFAWIDRITAEHANASRLLPRLDQAILAKAFRGELVPQDPNDPVCPAAPPIAERPGRRGRSSTQNAGAAG
jgi:hypothetical protein